mmetsp:Transcript_92992/g.259952  ORF Transcript_92992/g.259952 Transcript_92992/m.259952 type:complete len:273 (+) Transcript_92992:573-1391(+)
MVPKMPCSRGAGAGAGTSGGQLGPTPTHSSLMDASAWLHALPPLSSWMKGRPRVRTPLPHISEHVVQSPQSSQMQSTGQATASLQFRNSTPCWSSHLLPPLLATCRMPRVRFADPVAQDLEHSPHGSQLAQTQSTGQGFWLQPSRMVASPVQRRPFPLGCTSTVRARSRRPPPQVALQSLTLQGLQEQSMSQASLLQLCSSLGSPVQSWPPAWAKTFRCRCRCVQPPPQRRSQSDQPPQSLHSQLTGQSDHEQFCVCTPSCGSHVMFTPPDA